MPSARSASVSTPRPRPSCCRNVRRAVSIRPGRAGRRRPPVHRSRIRSIAASSRLLTSLAATRPRKRFMAGRSARYRHLHHLLDQHADEKPRQHRQELGHVGRRQEQGDQEEQRPGAEPVQGDVGRGRQRDREDARHVRSGPGARRDQADRDNITAEMSASLPKPAVVEFIDKHFDTVWYHLSDPRGTTLT